MTKHCNKCGETKSVEAFSKNKTRNDGLQSKCKDCERARRVANKDRLNAQNRAYREANKDRIAAYRASNRERTNAYNRAYREANKDRIAAYQREYNEKNKDRKAAYTREWRQSNPEKKRSHDHARRLRKQQGFNGPVDHKRIAEQMELLKDDPCRWCGTEDFTDGYHWDHIVPLSRGGYHVWWNLCKTCSTCNLSKHDKYAHEWSPKYV